MTDTPVTASDYLFGIFNLFSVAQSLVFCVLLFGPLIYILSFVGDFDDCFIYSSYMNPTYNRG
jgi:hypothetical protein